MTKVERVVGDFLVNNVSLLFIDLSKIALSIDYYLSNGRVIKDLYKTEEERQNAWNKLDTTGMCAQTEKIINPYRLEFIEHCGFDKRRIRFWLGKFGYTEMKFRSEVDGQTYWDLMDKHNFILVDYGLLINPILVDGFELAPINNSQIRFDFFSGRYVKHTYADPETCKEKLDYVQGVMENYEWTDYTPTPPQPTFIEFRIMVFDKETQEPLICDEIWIYSSQGIPLGVDYNTDNSGGQLIKLDPFKVKVVHKGYITVEQEYTAEEMADVKIYLERE